METVARRARPALALALLVPALWAAHEAEANFGSVQGFSGRSGVTCTACHQPSSPTQDDAEAHLDGLPAAWDLGRSYPIGLRVTGGPTPMPDPQAQGGFDLAADSGALLADPASPGLFRLPSTGELTYTPAGTHQRAWHAIWQAPDLAHLGHPPAPAHLWLAVLAANGNHVIAANASDGGETLDSTAAIHLTVPPSPDALAAWKALPLRPPSAQANRTATGWTVEGSHRDGNATDLLFRLDGGAWQERPTSHDWRLQLPLAARTLDLRSDGAGRSSPIETLILSETHQDGPARPVPKTAAGAHAAALATALALAAYMFRRRNQ